jgi:hypothetical protein
MEAEAAAVCHYRDVTEERALTGGSSRVRR